MAEIRSEDTLQVIHRNMLTYTRGEKRENHERNEEKWKKKNMNN